MKPFFAAALAFGVAVPAAAQTQTTGTDLGVSARLVNTCTVSASPVAFGPISTLGGTQDGEGAVTVRCTAGTYYELTADAGRGSGATHQARKMTAVDAAPVLAETLTYNLYVNTSRSVVWGDGFVQNGFFFRRTGTGGDEVIPIYGRVAAGQQGANPGRYADAVVVTLRY